MDLLSNRAEKTARLVLLPASTEDSQKAPPGIYRLMALLTCGSVSALFASLVIAYYWRQADGGFWDPIPLPFTLWISTGIILVSSITYELGRKAYARGIRQTSSRLFLGTLMLGFGFLISQTSAWIRLFQEGGYFGANNPYSAFFYILTGFHAAHLIGGLVALGLVYYRRNPRREFVDATAYYWHFLSGLWIALFITLAT